MFEVMIRIFEDFKRRAAESGGVDFAVGNVGQHATDHRAGGFRCAVFQFDADGR